ncbi:MAG: DUF6476 family protein [Roseovarius sp.]|nr:DUF6476 family protein [Roseovarius sp.]
MTENPQTHQPVDPNLVKYLRAMVTVLTTVMIVGFLIIVFLFVTKFSSAFSPSLPDSITLPDGQKPTAFTQGDNWFAVVTEDNSIVIFDRKTGEPLQIMKILGTP